MYFPAIINARTLQVIFIITHAAFKFKYMSLGITSYHTQFLLFTYNFLNLYFCLDHYAQEMSAMYLDLGGILSIPYSYSMIWNKYAIDDQNLSK